MIIGIDSLKTHWLLKSKARAKFFNVENSDEHLNRVKGSIVGRDIGVYVHIPYCRTTCIYCPYFRRVPRDKQEIDRYLEALLQEVRAYGKLLEGCDLRIVELHIGGGTPSLIPPAFYKKLNEELSTYFDVKSSVAIEVNPEDFRDQRIVEEFYSAGVREVSIGVQSFDGQVLRALGRRHTPEDSERAVNNALRAGFEWVNVDLMFLPPSIKGFAEIDLNYKLRAFKTDIVRAVELGAHQITYYPTIVPFGSPGYRLYEQGRLVQEGEFIDEFVKLAIDTLSSLGMHMSRVYSFSKKPYEYATVNLEMIGPLLGFGAGSWSNTGLYQYVNSHSIERYISMVVSGQVPASFYRVLKPGTRAWKLFIDQMITAGRMRKDAYRLIGERGFPAAIRLTLYLMKILGLSKDAGDMYELTLKGVLEAYKAIIDYVVRVPIYYTRYFQREERG